MAVTLGLDNRRVACLKPLAWPTQHHVQRQYVTYPLRNTLEQTCS